MSRSRPIARGASELRRARSLVRQVCRLAGQTSWIADFQNEAAENGIVVAVERHDTGAIFDWLMWLLSFQGISDAVAEGYMHQHGNVTWMEIATALEPDPGCAKLTGYWGFNDCGYHKGAQTCSEPAQFATCPLPRHRLRNGRLNQTAYSLYLYIRDVAGGDIVSWIDQQLKHSSRENL